MNGLEIGRLAGKARAGEPRAKADFIKLAKQEGFAGRVGGMLYRDGNATGIRGWNGLADRVYYGLVHFDRVQTWIGP
jgi:hypothetical protein